MKTSAIALVYLLSQRVVVDAQLANVPIKRRASSTTDHINDIISSSSKQQQRINTARLLKTKRRNNNKARLLEKDDSSMSLATTTTDSMSMSVSLGETTDSFAFSAGEEVLTPVFAKSSKANSGKSKTCKDCCRTTGTDECCASDEECTIPFQSDVALTCGQPFAPPPCCEEGPNDNACCDLAGGDNCLAPGVCGPAAAGCCGLPDGFGGIPDDSCCGDGETCIAFRVCGCPGETSDLSNLSQEQEINWLELWKRQGQEN